ncbi:hypothetical protein E2320_000556, partial [Naja naja]
TVQPDQHDILAQLGTVIGTETTQLLLRDPYLLILIVYMYVMHTQLYPDIFPTRKNNEKLRSPCGSDINAMILYGAHPLSTQPISKDCRTDKD